MVTEWVLLFFIFPAGLFLLGMVAARAPSGGPARAPSGLQVDLLVLLLTICRGSCIICGMEFLQDDNGTVEVLSPEKRRRLTKKQVGFLALRRSGLSVKDAAETIGYNVTHAHVLNKKLEKHSLKTPELAKLAKKAVTETLRMEAIQRQSVLRSGEVVTYEEKPSVSNRLDAARLVLERTEPAIRKAETVNLNGTLAVPVDLSRYLMPGETMPDGSGPSVPAPAPELEDLRPQTPDQLTLFPELDEPC